MNALLPYDPNLIEGYNNEYLAGFTAERYNETIDVSFSKAKSVMQDYIKRGILSQYSYDVVGDLHINTNYDPVCFNYVLMPMWVFGCKFKDKLYKFVVNGLTGKSTGRYPKSPPKILFTILLGLAVAAAVVVGVLFGAGII